jgi:RHS repeat-associated protein
MWGYVYSQEKAEFGGKTINILDNFTNHDYDEILGIYYANARFYDPVMMRFLASDPARDGLNWYTYADGNPLRFVDPTGLYYIVSKYDKNRKGVKYYYAPIKESGWIVFLKGLSQFLPFGMGDAIVDIQEENNHVVGGNSDTPGYDLDVFIKEAQKEATVKITEEAVAEISKVAGSALGWILDAKDALVKIDEAATIANVDNVVFMLFEKCNIDASDVFISLVEGKMNRAYEFVLANQAYFFNRPWDGADTYFEIQYKLSSLSDKEFKREADKLYNTYLSKLRNADYITINGKMQLLTDDELEYIADMMRRTVFNTSKETVDAVLKAYNEYVIIDFTKMDSYWVDGSRFK